MEKVKKLYVALVVLFLYAPIGVLVAQSFNASRYRGHWTGFTLQWYGELFQNEGILDALQNTVTIGLSSAAIATVLGLITCMPCAAWAANRARSSSAWPVCLCSMRTSLRGFP